MIFKFRSQYKKKDKTRPLNLRAQHMKMCYGLLIVLSLAACEDFLEVDLPKSQLTGKAVFEDRATAMAALADIYAQIRNNGLASGTTNGLSNLMGLYADEMDYYGSGVQQAGTLFHDHNLLTSDATIASWWTTSYGLIYSVNALLEGVENSSLLSISDKNQLKGEGLFIRAYLHLSLVGLYGDIPYIKTTDYLENSTVRRMSEASVYDNIITDLNAAANLLSKEDVSGEKVRPCRSVANALLARAYLYTEQWENAKTTASKVIDRKDLYVWEPDLEKVFMKNSSGTIWQFKPGTEGTNTLEGSHFIFVSGPPPGSAISNELLQAFEPGDQRRNIWIGGVQDRANIWYHAYKYKEQTITNVSLEYSVILRLAEQYFIRAEARAHLGEIDGALQDLNKIRNRAGLGDISPLSADDLLDAILQERRVELFTEQGHRWFDLKRTGHAEDALAPIKAGWKETDTLLPIPEKEILVNPNLKPQNPGY